MELVDDQSPQRFMGFTLQGRMTRAGRVRLRPNRGFPRDLAQERHPPMELVDQATSDSWGPRRKAG
jgi:hypothetical protein